MNRSRLKPKVLVLAIVLAGLAILGGLRSSTYYAANVTIPSGFFTVNDTQGPGDQPGQKDLTRLGRWNHIEPGPLNGYLDLFISWDDIVPSGGNTWDACALFSNIATGPTAGFATYAICAQVAGDANDQPIYAANYVYTCDGTSA